MDDGDMRTCPSMIFYFYKEIHLENEFAFTPMQYIREKMHEYINIINSILHEKASRKDFKEKKSMFHFLT